METNNPVEAPAAVPPVTIPLSPQTEKIKARFEVMSAESSALRTAAGGPLTDVAGDWLVAKFVTSAQARLDAAGNESERWTLLRLAMSDLGRFRRGDHSAGWLALQRARWEEEIREAVEARARREQAKKGLSREVLEQIERELKLF